MLFFSLSLLPKRKKIISIFSLPPTGSFGYCSLDISTYHDYRFLTKDQLKEDMKRLLQQKGLRSDLTVELLKRLTGAEILRLYRKLRPEVTGITCFSIKFPPGSAFNPETGQFEKNGSPGGSMEIYRIVSTKKNARTSNTLQISSHVINASKSILFMELWSILSCFDPTKLQFCYSDTGE